jgi:hypothetical protein
VYNLSQCTPGSAPQRDGVTRIDPTQLYLPVKVTDPEGPSLLQNKENFHRGSLSFDDRQIWSGLTCDGPLCATGLRSEPVQGE